VSYSNGRLRKREKKGRRGEGLTISWGSSGAASKLLESYCADWIVISLVDLFSSWH